MELDETAAPTRRPRPMREAERLLALGRSHLEEDDFASALRCFSRAFRASGRMAAHRAGTSIAPHVMSRAKLRHDLEQLQHLSAHGKIGRARAAAAVARYEHVLRLFDDGDQRILRVTPKIAEVLPATFGRGFHVYAAPRSRRGAISDQFDARQVERAYLRGKPKAVVVDGFLTDDALSRLRRFCHESTVWNRVQSGGYLMSTILDGFFCPLLFQIAAELKTRLPAIFGEVAFRQLAAVKYDSRRRGVGPHADIGAVNLNLWLTPDASNLDLRRGGLVIYDAGPPPSWPSTKFTAASVAIRRRLNAERPRSICVPYRENRAVIFDSSRFHETDRFRFAEGYEDRRLSIAFFYGGRSAGSR